MLPFARVLWTFLPGRTSCAALCPCGRSGSAYLRCLSAAPATAVATVRSDETFAATGFERGQAFLSLEVCVHLGTLPVSFALLENTPAAQRKERIPGQGSDGHIAFVAMSDRAHVWYAPFKLTAHV